MIRAWRRPDGRYRLEFEEASRRRYTRPEFKAPMSRLGAQWDAEGKSWVVAERGLAKFWQNAQKVYGVVAGPSDCGCEPAVFRWVTEAEVKAGRTEERICLECAESEAPTIFYRCDIVDVCGEADVAESVYEAEFKGGVEATR